MELLADRGVFLVVGDRAAALAEVDRAVVGELLARHAGAPRALIIRAVPGADAQGLLAGADVLVEPVARHRGRGDEPDRLVFLAQDLVGLAGLPWLRAERFRPGIGVALALHAHEHRGRGVLVCLRIAAGLVLADPDIEAVARHRRLDPPVAGRTSVIER